MPGAGDAEFVSLLVPVHKFTQVDLQLVVVLGPFVLVDAVGQLLVAGLDLVTDEEPVAGGQFCIGSQVRKHRSRMA